MDLIKYNDHIFLTRLDYLNMLRTQYQLDYELARLTETRELSESVFVTRILEPSPFLLRLHLPSP